MTVVTIKKNTALVSDLYGSDLREYLGDDEPTGDADAWIVHGVVAANVPQVIAGHPKSRKTFVAEHLAICVAAGIDWLGRFDTRQGRVLVLAREDSMRETQRRVWRLARGLDLDPRDLHDSLRVDSRTPFYFDDPTDVDRMKRTIEEWEPDLIVIDSLSRTHGGDENSKKDMGVVTNTWSDLCNRYDVAVQIIHHVTKSGDGNLLQRLRGTGDIGAVLRHVFEVRKTSANAATLEFDGNLHPLPEPFGITIEDGVAHGDKACIRIAYEGEQAHTTRHKIDAKILAALAEAPNGLNAGDLRKVGGKGRYIDQRRDALVEEGAVVIRNKRYHLRGVA